MPPSALAPKRPFSVTLLVWVVLSFTVLNWLRFTEVLRLWRFLATLEPAPPLFYLALIGLSWGVAGSALVWGLFLGRAWAPRLMQGAAILYTLYYWADRLSLANPTAIAERWPFALGLNLALVGFAFWVLSRPATQQFFSTQ